MAINEERLLDTFLNLVRIDSPSGQEADISAYLAAALRACEMDVLVDAMGNVLGRWFGSGDTLLLNAHMDTVPGCGIKPVVRDGVVRSDGTTILGGDDKSGIATILEVLHACRDQGRRPSVDVLFTVGEEVGLLGAKGLDKSLLRARQAVVLDSGGPLHHLVHGAPGSYKIHAVVHGRAAHAGANPEAGINAIQIAAQAIARMSLGRIDPETTANIGMIQGGSAVNIVPDRVEMWGETRSHRADQLQICTNAIKAALEEAVAQQAGARLDLSTELFYSAYRLPADLPLIQRLDAVLRAMGEPAAELRLSGGGSDANVFNACGIAAVPVSTGMQEVHTHNEWIAVSDMARCAALLEKVLLG